MATGVEDGDGSGSEELLKLVCDCVRDEIAMQRCSGNKSLLFRTKDLIAKYAKSASREASSSSALSTSVSISSSVETARQGFLSASALTSANGSSQSDTPVTD